MADSNTQEKRVLQYLEEHGTISRVPALLDLGIANLTAVISNIRERLGDRSIITVMVEDTNRYGQPVRYAIYKLGR